MKFTTEELQELLTIIDSRIVRFQKLKQTITNLLIDNRKQIDDMTDFPLIAHQASETTIKVHTILLKTNRVLSLKEIFEELEKEGIHLSDPRTRQILMRWKGRLFHSPKRGLWEAIHPNQKSKDQ